MRFDANSIKCDIDDINEKIDYLKYVIETKQDELDKMKEDIKNLYVTLSTTFLDTIDNKITSFGRDYHTQLITNMQKMIV